jgi:hypothetical protein
MLRIPALRCHAILTAGDSYVKTVSLISMALLLQVAANADFSYSQTRKNTGGMMASAAAGGPQSSKIALKGHKMRTETGAMVTIIDQDALTITTIHNDLKTYSIKPFSDVAAREADVTAKIDVKDTGQTREVNGYLAHELVMTMEVDSPQTARMGKMQMEIQMWLSSDVPGVKELGEFYQQNGGKQPWGAMAGHGNPALASAMAEIQKKIASMKGVQVQQVVKVKAPAGAMPARPAGPSAAQMQQMQAGMEKARAQLEAMAASGGPAAAIAKQQLAKMGPAPGAVAGGGAASGSLIEMTIDSSDFSTAAIPDSAFAVPAGYQKN